MGWRTRRGSAHPVTPGGTRIAPTLRLTNDSYLITLRAGSGVEHYYRDGPAWTKLSVRGRKFGATAEQVLNHLLPALAGVNARVSVEVRNRDLDPSAGDLLDSLRSS